jgi:hypothetical protein
MSEERQNQSGERRLERIRAEHGMPVRRAPIAVGFRKSRAVPATDSSSPVGTRPASTRVTWDALRWSSWSRIDPVPERLKKLWLVRFRTVGLSVVAR